MAARKKAASSGKAKRSSGRRWSQNVTERSDALDLDRGVFAKDDPEAIARSLKRSAEKSDRRKSNPFRSAMSMLNFFINRAGEQLSARRRNTLERAKDELREEFHRPTQAESKPKNGKSRPKKAKSKPKSKKPK